MLQTPAKKGVSSMQSWIRSAFVDLPSPHSQDLPGLAAFPAQTPMQAAMVTSDDLGWMVGAGLALAAVATAGFVILGGTRRWHRFTDDRVVTMAETKRQALHAARGNPKATGQAATLSWLARHHIDLQRQELSDLVLDGVELENADLEGVTLARCSLKAARMARAKLNGADLTSALLHDANLTSANLRGADLTDANLTRASVADADLSEIRAVRLQANEAKFWDCDLSGAILEDSVLEHAEFTGATMTGCNLNRTALGYAALDGTSMQRALLNGAHLDSATLQKADLRKVQMIEANLSNADLEHANLTWVHAEGADFSYAHLAGASLAGAVLIGAEMIGTVLDGADLTGADLSNVRNLDRDQLAQTFYRGAENPETERRNQPLLPYGYDLPPLRKPDSGY